MGFFSSDNTSSKLNKAFEKERGFSKKLFRDVLDQARNENRPLSEVLFEQNILPAERILAVLSNHFGLPTINLRQRVISPYTLRLIPKEVALEHSVIVFKKRGSLLHVATTVPENNQTFEFIRKRTESTLELYLTTPDDIRHALQLYGHDLPGDLKTGEGPRSHQTPGSVDEQTQRLAQDVSTVNTLNSLIDQALRQRASDIHFEPRIKSLAVRYRIDGLLTNIVTLPKDLAPSLVARIKLLANLKVDEHRAAQDGRFQYLFNNRDIAVRVSVIPTLNGAKVVLRLLDARDKQMTLLKLGLNDRNSATLRAAIQKPYGMILVTGPTGSGKTTTLYSLLRLINKSDVNICTIEDPIEYGIDGINQTQINPVANLTFANGLRSLLRQDPNVLMVGEIRDRETAEIAMNAAMTGHMVLSTLHTNSAFLAPRRLLEMGAPSFLVASVITVVVGQRLVRQVCPYCKHPTRSPQLVLERYAPVVDYEAILKKLRLAGATKLASPSEIHLVEGKGCDKCNQTGYRGRIGVYEILQMNEAISSAIAHNEPIRTIERLGVEAGTMTMIEDGFMKILQGLTTLAELTRVTQQ